MSKHVGYVQLRLFISGIVYCKNLTLFGYTSSIPMLTKLPNMLHSIVEMNGKLLFHQYHVYWSQCNDKSDVSSKFLVLKSIYGLCRRPSSRYKVRHVSIRYAGLVCFVALVRVQMYISTIRPIHGSCHVCSVPCRIIPRTYIHCTVQHPPFTELCSFEFYHVFH